MTTRLSAVHPARASTGVAPVRITHLLPDFAIGGGQAIVLNHLRHADRDRFDVRLAALSTAGGMAGPLASAVDHEPDDLEYAGDDVAAMRRIMAILRRDRPALLHVHSDVDRKLGQAAALVTGVPVVGHLHAEWIHLGPMFPTRPTPARRAAARARGTVRDSVERRTVVHYIAESERVRRLFRPLVHQPIAVMRQSIPLDRFRRDRGQQQDVRRRLGLGHETPVLVCVSRLVPGKGQAHVLEVAARLRASWPDLVLLLVGDGPERSGLEAVAARAGIAGNVRFLGDRDDVPDLLAAADVFVFASENEGFGLALLEAMASGLPVVAFHCDAFDEFVAPGVSGTLVAQGDVAALAGAVDALLGCPELLRRMGAAGREIVARQFPPDATARSFENVYDAVLASARPARRWTS
jgi:glycosyltransferase involved in cell wall biosynthesis